MTSGGVLYPLDATTLEPRPAYRVVTPMDGERNYGAGYAGAGGHSYAAIGYAVGFGP